MYCFEAKIRASLFCRLDFNIRLRDRKVTGSFKKGVPDESCVLRVDKGVRIPPLFLLRLSLFMICGSFLFYA